MTANSAFKQDLLLREYGRSIKGLVQHVLGLEDREERTKQAHLLVNLMGQLNPNLKDSTAESQQKLWNHLFVMSEGKLDVDAPFELSQMEYLNERPQKVAYQQHESRYKHYGRSVELLIKEAMNLEDPADIEGATITIAKTMKMLYTTYNRDNVSNKVVLDQLKEMSKGKLVLSEELASKPTLLDVDPRVAAQNLQQSNRGEKNFNNPNTPNTFVEKRGGGGGKNKKKKKNR